jgi:FtsP/CotA-like multicopper oxidase with cupredoxin domain
MAQTAAPSTFDEWVNRGTHSVELPTGVWVRIRFADLATLVAAQRVPDTLRRVASETFLRNVRIETGEEENPVDLDKLGELYELNMWLVSQMLVEPTLTADQVKLLPAEDIDLLIDLAMRERDTDARGRRLGVAPLNQFPGDDPFGSRAEDRPDAVEGDRSLDVDGVPV